MRVCASVCIPGTHRGQKRSSEAQILKSQTAVSRHVSAMD